MLLYLKFWLPWAYCIIDTFCGIKHSFGMHLLPMVDRTLLTVNHSYLTAYRALAKAGHPVPGYYSCFLHQTGPWFPCYVLLFLYYESKYFYAHPYLFLLMPKGGEKVGENILLNLLHIFRGNLKLIADCKHIYVLISILFVIYLYIQEIFV